MMRCPERVQCRESDGEAWAQNESVSSSGSREGNVCNDTLHVIGLYGPGDKISLFLQDWELAKEALRSHGPGYALPGNEWALVAGLPLLRDPLQQQEKPFSHRKGAVTKTERVVVRE